MQELRSEGKRWQKKLRNEWSKTKIQHRYEGIVRHLPFRELQSVIAGYISTLLGLEKKDRTVPKVEVDEVLGLCGNSKPTVEQGQILESDRE